MLYDPKIFIRDYGVPTSSVLVYSTTVQVALNAGEFLRNLIVNVVNPREATDGILLSGAAQVGGSDVLLLSGATGKLLLSDYSILRVEFHDVEILTGTFIDADAVAIDVEFHDAAVIRDLVLNADPLAIEASLNAGAVLRNLVVDPDPMGIEITLHDVEVFVLRHLLLSGAAQVSGTDRLLLSGAAQVSGTDSILLSE